ncbi:MAG: hypothetical protein PHW74_10470 [Desulfobacca sp.]|nr:hypothetical protein [Desulfobacca sp.]
MATSKFPGFLCGKVGYDSIWPGAKYCPNCHIQLCSKCGSGRRQCPKCGKHTLK